VTCLCFDLDGTLCDLWRGERIAKQTLLNRLVKYTDTPPDTISKTYDQTWATIKQHYMEMVNNGLTEHMIRIHHMKIMLNEFNIDTNPDQLATLHIETTMANIEIYPDAEKTVTELAQRHPVSMITNGAIDNQNEKIKRLPFHDLFKAIIISGELGHHKPSKTIFETMAEQMNTKPSEMIYIGNDYRKDILGARDAGWKTVWINRKDEKQDPTVPDWTIKELSELLEIF
jgi:HAD superfamily hydrolase (TIGR01549 family)